MDKKIKGALFGVAIGDALGGPLEFMKRDDIKLKHGTVTEMIGGGWLNLNPGDITDDTQMTLCVARGILDNPSDPISSIGENFINWINSNPKDVGITCKRVISEAKLQNLKTKDEWLNLSKKYDELTNGMSAGNGALMRTVYLPLYYEREGLKELSVTIGEMTHYSHLSKRCIECYVCFISDVINNKVNNPKEALEAYMLPVRGLAEFDTSEPTGFVVDSLVCAVNAISSTNSFEEALIKAVNNGGDADTIAAICGGLAGVIYGYDSIPSRWLSTLNKDVSDELTNLANVAYLKQLMYKNK